MTNEEKYLRSRMGTENPFRVPEGYFDNFAERFMAQLPEQPVAGPVLKPSTPTLYRRLRPLLYAAAFLLVAVLSVTVYLNRSASDEQEQLAVATTETQLPADNYFEEATEYAMLDNYDIYMCLASE